MNLEPVHRGNSSPCFIQLSQTLCESESGSEDRFKELFRNSSSALCRILDCSDSAASTDSSCKSD